MISKTDKQQNIKNKKILFVGLGNIGIRHFESISKSKQKYICFFIDPDIKKIKNKIIRLNKKHSLFFSDNFDFDEKLYDFTIISTNSDIRKDIINVLIRKFEIKKYLIEKIPFNNVKDYKFILNKFSKSNSLCYVNYVRNYMQCYMNIKKEINQKKLISLEVFGKNWNLASNSFHYLSLFAYLNNQREIFINEHKLSKPFKSKRKNFFEITGYLKFTTKRGDTLILRDQKNNLIDDLLIIKNDANIYNISESKKIIHKINTKTFKTEKKKFNYLYQSSMTEKILIHNNDKDIYMNKLNFNFNNEIKLLRFFETIFQKRVIKNCIPIT